MSFDLTSYEKVLKQVAYNILKDINSANDVVQDTYVEALLGNIVNEEQLKEICKKLAFKTFNYRKRSPDAPIQGTSWVDEGEETDHVWGKVQATQGELLAVIKDDINIAVTTITDYKGQWLPFVQAREYVLTLGFNSGRTYKKWRRKNPSVKLPACPDVIYVGEWKGWNDFLGNNFYTFHEFLNYFRTILIPRGVKTSLDFRKLSPTLPKVIPSSPAQVYKDEWRGWPYVFDPTNVKEKVNLYSYEQAKEYTKTILVPQGIDTLPKYIKNRAFMSRSMPANPHLYYAEKGWIGSLDFFGVKKEKKFLKREFLSYKEAREWVRLNLRIFEIKNSILYRDYFNGRLNISDLPPIPTNIPKTPEKIYKKDGFSWGDYLGTLYVDGKKKVMFNYDEAKKWIKNNLKNNVKTSVQWHHYVKGKYIHLPNLPAKVPKFPFRRYKLHGWKGWEDFLGISKLKKGEFISSEERKLRKTSLLPYNKARQYMMDFLVPEKVKKYNDYLKMIKKPACLPVEPHCYYKGKGWVSREHFLGLTEQLGKAKCGAKFKGLPYEEVKKWVAENLPNVKGQKDWRRWLKGEIKGPTRPSFIPAMPDITYRGKGWEGFKKFIPKTYKVEKYVKRLGRKEMLMAI